MRRLFFIWMGITLIALSGCGDEKDLCPEPVGTRQYLAVLPALVSVPTPALAADPILMEIGGRTILVDRVISGPLCNDSWSGTVYVGCDALVYAWEGDPTFLKDCHLKIAPDTVVYVAHHNDAAYYKGCSCHTGDISNP
jgi:hypothetical protein